MYSNLGEQKQLWPFAKAVFVLMTTRGAFAVIGAYFRICRSSHDQSGEAGLKQTMEGLQTPLPLDIQHRNHASNQRKMLYRVHSD